MYCVALWLILQLSVGLQQKETVLNAQIPSNDGVSIIHNPLNVDISDTTYNVIVRSDAGYDLKLALDDSWSFEYDTISSITLKLDGYTPFPSIDTDFLMVFSVSDWQYFSFFIHLDNTNKMKSRIYPSISAQSITHSVNHWILDDAINSRWDRISNNNEWEILYDWNKQSLWPLTFVITNDPLKDESVFQFYHNPSQIYATGYVFNGSFRVNQGIDVYIMGDSMNERYNISSFDIVLTHLEEEEDDDDDDDDPSIFPTKHPTLNPTYSPSNIPTIIPTLSPTIVPTLYPTYHPSIKTTNISTSNGILMVITFKYTFSAVEIKEIIVILQELTDTLDNDRCNEWDHDVVDEEDNATVISATILLCDASTQNELLVAANDGRLQSDILQSMKSHSMQIYGNKTWIIANRIEEFSVKTTELVLESPWRHDKDVDYYLVSMTILIAIPIISCCFLISYCKTKSRNRKKQLSLSIEMNEAMKVISLSNIPHDDEEDNMIIQSVRSPSSKSYQYRIRKDIYQNKGSIDNYNESCPVSPSSILIAPRDYKTRGISDDIYDNNSHNITNGGTNIDLYDEGYPKHCSVPKLSAESQINTNSYPQQTPVSDEATAGTTSPKYELPKCNVTKRQWL